MARWNGSRLVAAVALAITLSRAGDAAPPTMPRMTPDVSWLRMPAGALIGEISAVATDAQDNVWILHRPNSIPEADRAKAAAPVLAFDRTGKFLRGFGGPGQGYDWPMTEHSLAVDRKGRVWITGSFRNPGSPGDDMALVFSGEGRFLRQIGHRGASTGDLDTANMHAPADIFIDGARNEAYFADGYGNRRVIVFDTESGAFKRMWSAFGKPPPKDPAPEPRVTGAPFTPEQGEGPQGFNGVHAVEIARDGTVYVADRNNQRIQLFTRKGRYLRQVFVDRNLPSAQTASGIAFSPDSKQRYMYVSDWGNSRVLVYDRASLELLGSLGESGTAPGQYSGAHLIATDSKGVLYVAEVRGRRLQRLAPAE